MPLRTTERGGPAGPAASGTSTPVAPADTAQGFATAGAAYLIWGLLLPFLLKALSHVSPVEVMAHRILWAVPCGAAILIWLGRTADLKTALRSPRIVAMAAVTAAVISVNWGVYIYAIANNRALEASLGYYINPLISVLMGMALLGERPRPLQWVAITIAAIAVAVLTVHAGRLPWISLALALSFGTYGYLRKTLPIGPSQGFLLEVLILSPFAIATIVWFVAAGESHFMAGSPLDTVLLVVTGPMTAVPLILYAFGAKGLRLATIGLMQYIVPTLIFLIAVFFFREPFDGTQLFAFVLIWTALVIYTWTLFAERRENYPPSRQRTR